MYRAARFHFDRDRDRYIRSHVALRTILGRYIGADGSRVVFETGAFGKPAVAMSPNASLWKPEFNLAHSGDWALVAIAGKAVGVDVERWDAAVECRDLAEHYFSPAERLALAALADGDEMRQGFFQAWSRKEAYLKATGAGISNGLHHFDVSLAPGAPAALLGDRSDPAATSRWSMASIQVSDGYSAAVVLEGPLQTVRCYDY